MDYQKLLKVALSEAHYEQYGYAAKAPELTEAEQAELDRMGAEAHAEAKAEREANWAALRTEHPGKTDSEIRNALLSDLIRANLDFIMERNPLLKEVSQPPAD